MGFRLMALKSVGPAGSSQPECGATPGATGPAVQPSSLAKISIATSSAKGSFSVCRLLSSSAASSPTMSGRWLSVCPILTKQGPRPLSSSRKMAPRVRSWRGSPSCASHSFLTRLRVRVTTASRTATTWGFLEKNEMRFDRLKPISRIGAYSLKRSTTRFACCGLRLPGAPLLLACFPGAPPSGTSAGGASAVGLASAADLTAALEGGGVLTREGPRLLHVAEEKGFGRALKALAKGGDASSRDTANCTRPIAPAHASRARSCSIEK
mmetsp:Transcript_39957/g.89595  ORF Transcript_39957/g.89595 Transcript_39957/m.89595 type:complete len:267 (+) Transcript_39957:1140-1940(+)